MTEYQPGVCNIGKAEKRKRYGLGLAGAGLTAVTASLILANVITPVAIVGVLVFSFLAFEGLIQGYLDFCAGFASKGVYDVSEEGDNEEDVEDETARKKDKVRALQIHMYSITGSLTVTAFVYLAITIL
ncbi:MAG: hypothetical protein ABEK04_01930 [Candidatus Nanohalobium sp.]